MDADTTRLDEITRMLNALPSAASDRVLLLEVYVEAVQAYSVEAVQRAARRFLAGDVPDQDMTFAPTVPQFVAEVRRCEEYQAYKAAPRPSPAPPTSDSLMPFERARDEARAQYSRHPVLYENVSHEQALALSKMGLLPVGAFWKMGTVYGAVVEGVRQTA